MGYEDTMPPTGVPVESEEERNRRLVRESGGMNTMPPNAPPSVASSAPGSRNYNLSVGATNHPTMPPNVPGPKPEPTAPDLSKMPPNTFAPPSSTGAAPARPADTGAALGMPPAGKPADVRSSAFQAMPPNTPGPAEKHEAELRAQGRPGSPEGPDLPWWKRVLDTIAQAHPIGRGIERNIPGSPGNFDWELARATAAGEHERGVAKEKSAEQRANAPQHVGQFTNDEGAETEVSRDPQTGGFSTQNVGEVKDAKGNSADKKVDEGFNEKGQRVVTYQKADGSRYDAVNPDIVQKPPEDAGKLAAEIEAQVGKKPTTPQFQGKTYPSVEAAQQAWGQAGESIKNREAKAGREVLNQGKAINVLRTLPGDDKPQLMAIHPDELKPGDVLAGAGAGEHAMSKDAQFKEIRSGIENARSAINNLDKPFSAAQIGKLTMAMRHTNDPSVFTNEIETILGSQELTPAQQDFVIWMGHLNERALSLRNIAGMGQGSDSMRAAIQAILPGVKSGSKEMAIKQLAAFENQVDKLDKGVPTMPGGGAKSEKQIHNGFEYTKGADGQWHKGKPVQQP